MRIRPVFPLISLVLIGCLVPVSSADACSMVAGYTVPTNFELVERADVIVIAEVTAEKAGEDAYDNSVIAKPLALLKGAEMPDTVELTGSWLDESSDYPATRSDPRELRAPNPDALRGGCVRYSFSKGMKLVLFLTRNDQGVLVPYRSAFSRDAEDVSGTDALWVKAIREYVDIDKLPKNQREGQMRLRMAQLQSQSDDADALAIAQDMKVELSGRRLPPYD